jgi:hypothetical protein
MIQLLIKKGDLESAEGFAEQSYMNLRDKKYGMDQEGSEIATGAYNFAHVITEQKGDLNKAERLIREAICIRTVIYDADHHLTGACYQLLTAILCAQGNLGDETRELCERSLAVHVRHEGIKYQFCFVCYYLLVIYLLAVLILLCTSAVLAGPYRY